MLAVVRSLPLTHRSSAPFATQAVAPDEWSRSGQASEEARGRHTRPNRNLFALPSEECWEWVSDPSERMTWSDPSSRSGLLPRGRRTPRRCDAIMNAWTDGRTAGRTDEWQVSLHLRRLLFPASCRIEAKAWDREEERVRAVGFWPVGILQLGFQLATPGPTRDNEGPRTRHPFQCDARRLRLTPPTTFS